MILASLLLLADVTLTLPSEAKVRGTELELAEIVDVRCDDAPTRERIGHFTLGWAPAPGYSRLVQRWQLARDVHAAFPGIAIELVGAETCRVLPLTQHIQGGELAKAARTQIDALFQGRDAQVRPSSTPVDLEVPAPSSKIELRSSLDRRELRGGTWSVPVQVWIDGLLYQTTWVGFSVDLWAEVPVLVRDIARGELCSPDMVETRRVKVEGDTPFAALDGIALSGAVAQRDLVRGAPVTDRDVRRAKLVAIGQPITLEVRKGAITARSTVTCRQDGALGDTVKIVNVDASRELSARVVGRGLVRIEL